MSSLPPTVQSAARLVSAATIASLEEYYPQHVQQQQAQPDGQRQQQQQLNIVDRVDMLLNGGRTFCSLCRSGNTRRQLNDYLRDSEAYNKATLTMLRLAMLSPQQVNTMATMMLQIAAELVVCKCGGNNGGMYVIPPLFFEFCDVFLEYHMSPLQEITFDLPSRNEEEEEGGSASASTTCGAKMSAYEFLVTLHEASGELLLRESKCEPKCAVMDSIPATIRVTTTMRTTNTPAVVEVCPDFHFELVKLLELCENKAHGTKCEASIVHFPLQALWRYNPPSCEEEEAKPSMPTLFWFKCEFVWNWVVMYSGYFLNVATLLVAGKLWLTILTDYKKTPSLWRPRSPLPFTGPLTEQEVAMSMKSLGTQYPEDLWWLHLSTLCFMVVAFMKLLRSTNATLLKFEEYNNAVVSNGLYFGASVVQLALSMLLSTPAAPLQASTNSSVAALDEAFNAPPTACDGLTEGLGCMFQQLVAPLASISPSLATGATAAATTGASSSVVLPHSSVFPFPFHQSLAGCTLVLFIAAVAAVKYCCWPSPNDKKKQNERDGEVIGSGVAGAFATNFTHVLILLVLVPSAIIAGSSWVSRVCVEHFVTLGSDSDELSHRPLQAALFLLFSGFSTVFLNVLYRHAISVTLLAEGSTLTNAQDSDEQHDQPREKKHQPDFVLYFIQSPVIAMLIMMSFLAACFTALLCWCIDYHFILQGVPPYGGTTGDDGDGLDEAMLLYTAAISSMVPAPHFQVEHMRLIALQELIALSAAVACGLYAAFPSMPCGPSSLHKAVLPIVTFWMMMTPLLSIDGSEMIIEFFYSAKSTPTQHLPLLSPPPPVVPPGSSPGFNIFPYIQPGGYRGCFCAGVWLFIALLIALIHVAGNGCCRSFEGVMARELLSGTIFFSKKRMSTAKRHRLGAVMSALLNNRNVRRSGGGDADANESPAPPTTPHHAHHAPTSGGDASIDPQDSSGVAASGGAPPPPKASHRYQESESCP